MHQQFFYFQSKPINDFFLLSVLTMRAMNHKNLLLSLALLLLRIVAPEGGVF